MAQPANVAELLERHNLGRYTATFDAHGWDDVDALLTISEADLTQLVSDVEMPSGHLSRLRIALGKPAPDHTDSKQRVGSDRRELLVNYAAQRAESLVVATAQAGATNVLQAAGRPRVRSAALLPGTRCRAGAGR